MADREVVMSQWVLESTRNWVDQVVVGLSLCPFAKTELDRDRVHFVVTRASSEVELLAALAEELNRLDTSFPQDTSLLIHPEVCQDFSEYNQFLSSAEMLLQDLGMEGVYQIASFHPDYQFAGTQPDDAENYTNRSPYPMMHLIREEILEQALKSLEHPEEVPARNIDLLRGLGSEKMRQMLAGCFPKHSEEAQV